MKTGSCIFDTIKASCHIVAVGLQHISFLQPDYLPFIPGVNCIKEILKSQRSKVAGFYLSFYEL